MRVGPAESEAADSRKSRPIAGEFDLLVSDPQAQLLEGNRRVGRGEICVRRYDPGMQNQSCLDQTGNAGGRFKMPNIAFPRADKARLPDVPAATGANHRAQRGG